MAGDHIVHTETPSGPGECILSKAAVGARPRRPHPRERPVPGAIPTSATGAGGSGLPTSVGQRTRKSVRNNDADAFRKRPL